MISFTRRGFRQDRTGWIPRQGVADEIVLPWVLSRVRAGNSELHNIASFVGGVVSQEAIKLLTHQYVPMNNTFVFDGMKSRSEVFQL